jgi:hypothetical protein
METNPNDPASPVTPEINPRDPELSAYFGLTKLEAFTMAAMQGLCAPYYQGLNPTKPKEIAESAVFIAKATIEALNNQ